MNENSLQRDKCALVYDLLLATLTFLCFFLFLTMTMTMNMIY